MRAAMQTIRIQTQESYSLVFIRLCFRVYTTKNTAINHKIKLSQELE